MVGRLTQDHYRPVQIILHWIVVVGVIIQIVIHEAIVRVTDALVIGELPSSADIPLAWGHVSVGFMIFLAVLARLYLRFKYGTPNHAPGTPSIQVKIAQLMHWMLYVLLLGMVFTGMLTWNGIAPLGGAHFVINVVLFVSVIIHVLAALYNQYVRKDGTLSRMRLKWGEAK